MTGTGSSPEITDPIAGSGPQPPAPPASTTEKQAAAAAAAGEHVEDAPPSSSDHGSAPDLHKKGALGFIQQQHTIPTTGRVMPTGKWEYIFFCIYCTSTNKQVEHDEPLPTNDTATDFSNNGARKYMATSEVVLECRKYRSSATYQGVF